MAWQLPQDYVRDYVSFCRLVLTSNSVAWP